MLEKIPPPVITKEHGSWAVLIVPIFVNAWIAGKWSIDMIFVVASAFGIFMSYVPAQVLLRHYSGAAQANEKLRQAKFWAGAYLFAATAFVVPLLLKGYILLLAIGITGMIFFFCNFFFFGWSVFYVHMKIQAFAEKKADVERRKKMSLGKVILLYDAVVVTIVVVLATTHFMPMLALVAFVPMILHGVYGALKLSTKVHFKKLGLLLLGQSILFAVLLSYAFVK